MMVVQKFGGTSVATVPLIHRVAGIVKRKAESGHLPVVVVSAMAGVTDQLTEYVKNAQLQEDTSCDESDAVISSGEQIVAGLLAIALTRRGVPAKSLAGWQIPIETDAVPGNATVRTVGTDLLNRTLSNGVVPVVAGFQGVGPGGRITTLGRGGSDLTAVVLTAALKADMCEIYTDVDGIYTADPRYVRDARRFDVLSYEDMLLLAEHGAKVLHAKAVDWAKEHRVPVRVLSTFSEHDQGTDVQDTSRRIGCGIVEKKALQWRVPGVLPSIATRLYNILKKNNIIPVQWNVSRFLLSFLTWTDQRRAVEWTLRACFGDFCPYECQDISLITLIGEEIHAKEQGRFRKFFEERIPVQSVFRSSEKTGVIVAHQHAKKALNKLHNALVHHTEE